MSDHLAYLHPPVRSGLRLALTAGFLGIACALCPTASAQPPGFPDLNSLTDVTPDYIGINPRDSHGFNFVTAEGGFSCGGSTSGASCSGAFPGLEGIPMGPAQGPCELGFANAFPTGGSITRNRGTCDNGGSFRVLNVGQRVSYGPTTCGVFPGSVTACVSGEHGFVLQPSGSWAY